MAKTRPCLHCKNTVPEGTSHDCWTTTEAALTRDLTPDLHDAWERIRETAVEFGDQRIYASHNSIMFSRMACYFFVRPRRQWLEVWIFLGRVLKAPQVRKVMQGSSVKHCHLVQVRHRDEVEAPLTDWLREAYAVTDTLTRTRAAKTNASQDASTAKTPRRKAARRAATRR